MNYESHAIKRARNDLIQQTLNKIAKIRDFHHLKSNTYVTLAHLWLHKTAEQEKLFDAEEWTKPESRDELIKKIKEFLIKHVR